MNLLLDTHAFLWWLRDDRSLGKSARLAIEKPGNVVYVSAVSALEIAIKRAGGRLSRLPPRGDVGDWIEANRFIALPIEVRHATASAALPRHHADPFDRLLVAQARMENLTLMASDREISKYRVKLLDAAA